MYQGLREFPIPHFLFFPAAQAQGQGGQPQTFDGDSLGQRGVVTDEAEEGSIEKVVKVAALAGWHVLGAPTLFSLPQHT